VQLEVLPQVFWELGDSMSFFTGFSQGIQANKAGAIAERQLGMQQKQLDLQTRQVDANIENQKAVNDLKSLAQKQEQRKLDFEQKKYKLSQNLESIEKVYDASVTIKDPIERAKYVSTIPTLKSYQELTPQLQESVDALLKLPQLNSNEIIKAKNEFQKYKDSGDIDGMQRASIMFTTRFGNSDNEGVKKIDEQMRIASGLQTPAKQSSLSVLQDELKGLDPKSQEHKDTLRRIEKLVSPTGQKITIGPNGEVVIEEGANMERKTKANLEETVVGLGNEISNLSNIEKNFNSESLTLKSFAKNIGLNIKNKWLGQKLTSEQEKFKTGMKELSRVTTKTIMQKIYDLSGKAITRFEIDNFQEVYPFFKINNFSDFFDNDSPVDFLTKLKGAQKDAKYFLDRTRYLLQNGLIDENNPVTPQNVDEYSEMFEIYEKLRIANPNATQQQLNESVTEYMGRK